MLRSLGRYTHRVGISNQRLQAIDAIAAAAKPIPPEQAEAREQLWTPAKAQAASAAVAEAVLIRSGRVANPRLASQQGFRQLQDELAGTENRMAVERRKYNEAVQHYNTDIELFPQNIAASLFGFHRNDAYFKAETTAKEAPKVKF